MLVEGIKSRPVYTGLKLDACARHHLVALEGQGAEAALDMFRDAPAGALACATLLYVGNAGNAAALKALGADSCDVFPSIPTLLIRLKGYLVTAKMTTRLYVAGTEGFIGQAMQLALDHGIDFHSVLTEHRGSLARRVQCVHCKGMTENVTTNFVQCQHCGVHLLVRDHFSRRLGAFMGVSANAEAPHEIPQAEEIFK
ncbi:dimethylamine monooxygenase subunit DmmA family protein [Dongia sp.]|uniref:dimethylamine monooxygenase subunit DmmA family protein n=1 Tax=Dongia sp. TaxID=1977262 RepID=UPI0035B479C0